MKTIFPDILLIKIIFSHYQENNINAPLKEFLAGFSVRGLVVSKKKSAASRRVFVVFKNFPRLRRGFIVVQRSVFLLQIFTVFAL